MPTLPTAARLTVAGFVVATAFVWVQRLVNLANGDEASIVGSFVLSVVLLVSAAAVAVGLVVTARAGWPAPPSGGVATVWRVAAGVTIVVWLVRAVQITLAWRSPAFVAVHVVLAVVSVALAAGLWRAAGGWRPGAAGR